MAKLTVVASARKPGVCGKCGKEIKPTESYVWWKFRMGAKQVRCNRGECYPRRQELTQSEWQQRVADFEDEQQRLCSGMAEYDTQLPDIETMANDLDALAQDVRDFGEEQQEKLDNMPESLQGGEVGQLLQERADHLDSVAGELETQAEEMRCVDVVDPKDGALLAAFRDGHDCNVSADDFDTDAEFQEAVAEAVLEYNRQQVATIMDEVEAVAFDV